MSEQTAPRPLMEEPSAVHPVVTQALPAVPPTVTEVPARKDRRLLRTVLRWTAAVAVFAAVGSATAYGVTSVERTDLPGLATESDGRWAFPEATAAPLPSGSPGPFADSNPAGAHYADLRALLAQAPEGATTDKALRGTEGWLATDVFLKEYRDEEEYDGLRRALADEGLRHIAARGWTTPDGTHTRIYLLQFDTAAVVDGLHSMVFAPYDKPAYASRGTEEAVLPDKDFPERALVDDILYSVYAEPEPYGAEQVRQAYLGAGDILAVVLQSREGGAPAVPFQQTVALQSRLLA
ncbi:hypothetical protein ACFTXB_18440 [Streptomyces sp. NPDC057074]|uniref:hypothetical protein n=1 Tax=Streptomyces sp. NPDC057074 TaxID=3346015 RepID=UPI0036323808